jgi:hypothetical protein
MAVQLNTLNRPQFATSDDMSEVFFRNQPELEWFAYFITGSEAVADACVVDARTLSLSHNPVFHDWLLEWARYATIRSAIHAQRNRQMLNGSTNDRWACAHASHDHLTPSTMEFVIDNDELLIKRLDALSRIALVVYGMEKHALAEAAILSGVSPKVMRKAYCAALHCLNVLQCEQIKSEGNYSPLCH